MGDVRPEFVFLGYLAEGPAHGYHLYQCFRKDLEGLWHISESQMYASLKRLQRRGWIALDPAREGTADTNAAEGKQSRQRFSLTREGLMAYETWLNTPTAASPRLLKLEFVSRLYFALRRDVELAYTLIGAQRLALEAELERLRPYPGRPSGAIPPDTGGPASPLFDISILAKDFRFRQIRAALEWLQDLME